MAPPRDGCWPITTSPEDELNLHTDGELLTGEKKQIIITTENQKTRRRSSRESKQPNRYGGGVGNMYKNFLDMTY